MPPLPFAVAPSPLRASHTAGVPRFGQAATQAVSAPVSAPQGAASSRPKVNGGVFALALLAATLAGPVIQKATAQSRDTSGTLIIEQPVDSTFSLSFDLRNLSRKMEQYQLDPGLVLEYAHALQAMTVELEHVARELARETGKPVARIPEVSAPVARLARMREALVLTPERLRQGDYSPGEYEAFKRYVDAAENESLQVQQRVSRWLVETTGDLTSGLALLGLESVLRAQELGFSLLNELLQRSMPGAGPDRKTVAPPRPEH